MIKFHKLTRVPKGARDAAASAPALPAGQSIAVIIKMPRQSKWSGTRIRDFERVPGLYDDRHIFKGRPLTVEEFNSCAEKVFGDTTFAYRVVPQIIPAGDVVAGGTDPGSPGPLDRATENAPSIEDAKAMLAEIDRLREENDKLRAVVDGIGAAAAVDEHAEEPDPERPVAEVPAEAPAEEPPAPEAVAKKKGKK